MRNGMSITTDQREPNKDGVTYPKSIWNYQKSKNPSKENKLHKILHKPNTLHREEITLN